MMTPKRFVGVGMSVAILATCVPIARADGNIDLDKNRVVPVILDSNLSVRRSHRGDRVSATVENGYDLPARTRLFGHIVDVHRKSDIQPPYLEVSFDEMRLPNGDQIDIQAEPIALDSHTIKPDRYGRLYASKKVIRRDQAVAGGAIAGLVLGSLIKKPLEGAIIGAVAGIVVGNNQPDMANDISLPRGTRMGALFESPLHLVYRARDWNGDRYSDNSSGRGGYDDNGNWRDQDVRGQSNDNDRNRRGSDGDRYNGSDRRYRNDQNTRVSYKGKALRYSAGSEPYWIGDVLMVPLNRTAEQLGLSIDSYQSDNTIIVQDMDSHLRLEHGSRDYRLNGRYGTMPHQLEVRNGVTYVPIDVLARMKHDAVLVNGNRVEGIPAN